MPTKVKLLLTAVVALIGGISVWLEATFSQETVAMVIAGLAVFMIVALWMFPEAGAKDDSEEPH